MRLSIQNEIEKSHGVTNEYVNVITQKRTEDTLNLVTKVLKDKSWLKNSPSLHLFKSFTRTLCVKQYSFKDHQNRATKTLIQKGSITSTPKPSGN